MNERIGRGEEYWEDERNRSEERKKRIGEEKVRRGSRDRKGKRIGRRIEEETEKGREGGRDKRRGE